MAWVSDYKYTWFEKIAMNIIKAGGCLPHHIAFVMDGNRRYANSERIQKIEGHSKGFEKLSDCLRWCLDIGIHEVTAFAFSIENFKRSEEEVNGLLDLARDKFKKLLEEIDRLHRIGVRLRVIGNILLLPSDLQQLIAKAMLETEHNNKLFLNIAFCYTSRDEITQAVKLIVTQGGDILQTDDISEFLVEDCLYTRHSPPPDLLFRTSGETRISDFLMWQLSTTVLYFTNVLWPQITIWNFFAGIFNYQRAALRLKSAKSQNNSLKYDHYSHQKRIQFFLQYSDLHRKNVLLGISNT